MLSSTDNAAAAGGRALDDRGLWSEAIALFFEAAGSYSRQRAFVATLQQLFEAEAAAFMVWAEQPEPLLRAMTTGLDFADLENAHSLRRDAAESLFARLDAAGDGAVITGCWNLPGSPRVANGPWLAGVVDNDARSRSAVLVLRAAGDAAFEVEALAAMRELLGYLKRGIHHNRWFERHSHTAQIGTFLMDRALRGIMVFSPDGAVTYCNAEAQRILGDNDGLTLDGDRLDIADEQAGRRCRDFLDGARAGPDRSLSGRTKMSTTLRLNRPSGKAPLQAVLYRLPTGRNEAMLDRSLGLIACMIHDPEQAVAPSADSIRRFFRLTPAETNLAVALLRRHRLPEAAESLGISVNTARTQLKSIFHKLGVNSQPALMQRLTRTLELRDTPPANARSQLPRALYLEPDA